MMRLGIRTSRDLAWSFAVSLSDTSSHSREIAKRDDDTAWLGSLIARRWSPVHLLGWVIARAESRSVAEVVEALTVTEVDLDAVARRVDVEARTELEQGTSLRVALAERRRLNSLLPGGFYARRLVRR